MLQSHSFSKFFLLIEFCPGSVLVTRFSCKILFLSHLKALEMYLKTQPKPLKFSWEGGGLTHLDQTRRCVGGPGRAAGSRVPTPRWDQLKAGWAVLSPLPCSPAQLTQLTQELGVLPTVPHPLDELPWSCLILHHTHFSWQKRRKLGGVG